jgi:hypothetical protein
MVRFRLSPAGGLLPDVQAAPVPFGEIEDYKVTLGKVGNLVWEDYDFNGIQDAGEPGIDGVSVMLTWLGADGAVGGVGADADVNYPALTTGGPNGLGGNFETGEYYFSGLTDGPGATDNNYKITYITPANMTPTRSDQGSQINGGMTDSDGIITGMDFTMTMETFSFTLPTLTAENGLGDSGTAATAGFPDTQVDESHDQGFAFLDYGDLPAGAGFPGRNYPTTMQQGGPIHVILPNFKLGSTVNGNVNGLPSMGASGDMNDENGMAFAPSVQLSPGGTIPVTVTAMNPTGAAAVIQGWFDWNDNGTFEAGEEMAPITVPATGLNAVVINIAIPGTVSPTMCDLYARFRLSRTGGLGFAGPDKYGAAPVPQGEVEDYRIAVAPIAMCPANKVLPNDPGVCGAVVTFPPPVPFVCPGWIVTLPQGLPSGSVYPVGTTIVQWKVTDATGFMSTCSFSVTVNDVEKPVITCPGSMTVNATSGSCGAVVNYPAVVATDNCVTVNITRTLGLASGSNFPPGTTTMTYRATDGALTPNTTECTFTVTVVESQGPSIVCPANVSTVTAPGLCTASVTYPLPTATDNCPVSAVQLMHVSGGMGTVVGTATATATFAPTINTVIWKATDATGNTKTCSFRVIVMDNQAPVFACPTAPVVLNTNTGACTATAAYTAPTATDNCTSTPTITRISGPALGALLSPGRYYVAFRATDASGRASTCQLRLDVVDAQTPTLTCPNSVTQNAGPTSCCVPITYVMPTATDNCQGSVVYVHSGLVSGSLFCTGVSTVVLRATDIGGNSTTCQFTVTINDTQAPVLTCPPNVTVAGTGNPCGFESNLLLSPIIQENCEVVTLEHNAPTRLLPGTTTVQWTVTDEVALTGTCQYNVTVLSCGARPGVDERDSNMADAVSLQLAPNPAVSEVLLRWSGVTEAGGHLVLYDALGREVWRSPVRTESGVKTLDVQATGMAAGMYRVALQTKEGVVSRALMIAE